MKGPYQPIMHHKMKARTPLVSHQNDDVIGSPSYCNATKVGTTNTRYGEATCNYSLGGISWSLSCTHHTELSSTPTTTTNRMGCGK